jgi:hypothetical protein
MTRITIHAVPVGRGRWSPLVITYDTARRKEQPTAIELRRGHVFEFNGARYRVQRVHS